MSEVFPSTAHCPRFQETIELVGRRWTAAILRSLFAGCAHFTEIVQAVPGLSHRLLSERLEELSRAGLVESSDGPRPVYSLTSRGRDLEDALEAIEAWNTRWSVTDSGS